MADTYYSSTNCILYNCEEVIPVGTLLMGISTSMGRLKHSRVGTAGVLVREYTPEDRSALLNWGRGYREIEWANAEALVQMPVTDFLLASRQVLEVQSQLERLEPGDCRYCGREWQGVKSFYKEDPGLSQQDHKPPQIGYRTKCCSFACEADSDFSVAASVR